MASDPKNRPRAFRLESARSEPKAEAPQRTEKTDSRQGQTADETWIEATPDPFEAEAAASTSVGDITERAVEAAQEQGIVRRSLISWGGLFWSAAGGLLSLAFGLWLTKLLDDLFVRSVTLGWIGVALAALAALALFILAGREISGIARQRRIVHLHSGFAAARAEDDRDKARRLVGELAGLYVKRPQTARARTYVLELTREIVDGRDLVEIAERSLMQSLDVEVRREIALATKRVSMVTAISPRALLDVLFVAAQAIRLIRRIAEIYGGRPGFLGFLKLARSVGAHIAITGGMAIGDSLIQQMVGHCIAAKLSARLGEGVLNGLLTARIGLSAMAVCRPMPFATEPSPGVRDVAPFLFEKKG